MIPDTVLYFFAWLGQHSWAYWTVAWSSFGLLLLSAALPLKPRPDSRPRTIVFLSLLALAVAAFRWPALFHGDLWNMDECQMIAGAITFAHNPLPWLSVDPTSTGPLDDYALLLPRLLGLPCTFFTARLVGLLLIWTTLSAGYLTLRTRASQRAARLGVLPMTVFFCCTTHWDFIHYTSEHLPFCLLALATMLLFTARGREGFSAVRLFLCGLCLGAVPFAKLQGSPLALWTALFACILILAAKLPVKLRIRPILLLCAGGVAPALLLLAILLANGLFGDFYQCYIINNIAYSQGSLPLSAYVHFITHGGEPGFMLFLLPCLGYALVSALLLPLLSTRNRALCLYALGTVVVACYVIMAPGRPHGHYFLFLIPPLGLAAGAAFCGHWEKLLQERSWPRSLPHWTMLLLFPLLCLAPQVYSRMVTPHPYLLSAAQHRELTSSPVSRFVLQHAQPGDAMAMWGWMPLYYVETGLRQGTREAHSERQLSAGPQQAYYLQRYYTDIVREKPAFFLDAVGLGNFGYAERDKYGHENFPPLKTIIRNNYRLVADILGVRIFIRNDRISN